MELSFFKRAEFGAFTKTQLFQSNLAKAALHSTLLVSTLLI